MMPDSIAEKSSRSSTSRPRRADSAAIRSRNRSWESPSQVTSGCRRLDAYPLIAVSGVRSSWLSRDRKPRCSSRDLLSAAASWCACPASSRSSASRSEFAASSISDVSSLVGGTRRQVASSTVGPPAAMNATALARCLRLLRSCLATPSRCGLDSAAAAISGREAAAESGSVPSGPA